MSAGRTSLRPFMGAATAESSPYKQEKGPSGALSLRSGKSYINFNPPVRSAGISFKILTSTARSALTVL